MNSIKEGEKTNYLLKQLIEDEKILIELLEEQFILFKRSISELSKKLENVNAEKLVSLCSDFIKNISEIEKFRKILETAREQLKFKGYDLGESETQDISRAIHFYCTNVIKPAIKKARKEGSTS